MSVVQGRAVALIACGCVLQSLTAPAQIDPEHRELVQLGLNVPLEGHPPQAAYAFYYRNQPGFLETNLTLRLALAPTYLDSELGISQALGQYTDIGIGVAGGGYADTYNEIRGGKYLEKESFYGYSGEVSASVYHLFNPGRLVPLNGVFRLIAHYTAYDRESETAFNFRIPRSQDDFSLRTGLRWGGREPTLFPALAMELSIWYQGEFRPAADTYGFGDRSIQRQSHLFWGEALLDYTLPDSKQAFYIGLTAGTSIDADRFSAYRLGAFLPLSSEFPLSLPGYFYQEISAKEFALLGANYIMPLEASARWNLCVNAAGAVVDYLPGLQQPGLFHAGVGTGVFYASQSWRVLLGYGYGVEAIRDGRRGAHSIGLLVQLDLTHAKQAFYNAPASRFQGFQRILGVFGD